MGSSISSINPFATNKQADETHEKKKTYFSSQELEIEQNLFQAMENSPHKETHEEQQNARFNHLFHVIKEVARSDIDGLIIECGTFKGKSINYISSVLKRELSKLGKDNQEIIYGLDSFEGLEKNWNDEWTAGSFKLDQIADMTSEELNNSAFIAALNDNISLIKGYFENTIPQLMEKTPNEPIKFLHIDCDLHTSTKTIFEKLGDRIIEGSIIAFDELINFEGWRGDEWGAFVEFLDKTGWNIEPISISNHEQVAFKIVS